MPVVHCPNCRKSINAPEGSLGRKATCPACKKPFVIGGKAPASVVPAEKLKAAKPVKTAPPKPVRAFASLLRPPLVWAVAGGGIVAVLLTVVILVAMFSGGREKPRLTAAQPEKKVAD
ncbi:MAG: hypothetical protein WCL32_24340, partial [Planctomycetota bacterium]